MISKTSRKRTANTLALHYFNKDKIDDVGWFEFVEKWFIQSGHTPDKMGGKGRSHITFKRGKTSLITENYDRLKKEGLAILALLPEEEIKTEAFDYKLSVSLYKSKVSERGSDCIFSWDNSIILWDDPYINNLCKDVWKFLKPQYGYAFQRIFAYGPSIYPSGIGTGSNISNEEGYELGRWGAVGLGKHSAYRPYMIRDVYPLNYLSPQHLQADVDGKTLEKWILSDPIHGTLEEIAPDFYCWTVDPPNIEALRQELKPYNILIAFLEI